MWYDWTLDCLVYLDSGSAGAEWKCFAFGGREKKIVALRSLRRCVLLVTPNFRENHTEEEGEGENNAIFLVTIFFNLNVFRKNEFTIHTQEQTARAAHRRGITIIRICNQMRKTDAAPKLANRNRVLHLGHTDIRFSALRAADSRTEDNAAS